MARPVCGTLYMCVRALPIPNGHGPGSEEKRPKPKFTHLCCRNRSPRRPAQHVANSSHTQLLLCMFVQSAPAARTLDRLRCLAPPCLGQRVFYRRSRSRHCKRCHPDTEVADSQSRLLRAMPLKGPGKADKTVKERSSFERELRVKCRKARNGCVDQL